MAAARRRRGAPWIPRPLPPRSSRAARPGHSRPRRARGAEEWRAPRPEGGQGEEGRLEEGRRRWLREVGGSRDPEHCVRSERVIVNTKSLSVAHRHTIVAHTEAVVHRTEFHLSAFNAPNCRTTPRTLARDASRGGDRSSLPLRHTIRRVPRTGTPPASLAPSSARSATSCSCTDDVARRGFHVYTTRSAAPELCVR